MDTTRSGASYLAVGAVANLGVSLHALESPAKAAVNAVGCAPALLGEGNSEDSAPPRAQNDTARRTETRW